MTTRLHLARAAGGVLLASLAFGQPVLAQQNQQQRGSTTGPAVGTPVLPSTAVQKDNPAATAGSGGSGAAAVQPGAVGVGAPGVAAKPGSEGGSSSAPGSGKRP